MLRVSGGVFFQLACVVVSLLTCVVRTQAQQPDILRSPSASEVVHVIESCESLSPAQSSLLFEASGAEGESGITTAIARAEAVRQAARRNGVDGLSNVRKAQGAAQAIYTGYSGARELVTAQSWLLRKASDLIPHPAGEALVGVGIDALEHGSKILIKHGQARLFEQVLDPKARVAAYQAAANAQTKEESIAAASLALDDSFRDSNVFKALNSEDKEKFLFSVGSLLKDQVDHNWEEIQANRKVITENAKSLANLEDVVGRIAKAVTDLQEASGRVELRVERLGKTQVALASLVQNNNNLISKNLAEIKSNSKNIAKNSGLIKKNSGLIAANSTAIETLKGGVFGGLSTDAKLAWLKSGFFSPAGVDIESEIKSLKVEKVREQRLALVGDVANYAQVAQGAAALMSKLDIGGDLPEVISTVANYAMQAANIVGGIMSGQWSTAIVGVIGLFGGGGPDVAAIRHQQLVDMMMGNRKLLELVLKNQKFMIERIVEIEKAIHEYHFEVMVELRRIEWHVVVNSELLEEIQNRSVVKAEIFVDAMRTAGQWEKWRILWELEGGRYFAEWMRDVDALLVEKSALFRVSKREGGFDFDKKIYGPLSSSIWPRAMAEQGSSLGSLLAVSQSWGELRRKIDMGAEMVTGSQGALAAPLRSAAKICRVSRLTRNAAPVLVLQNPSSSGKMIQHPGDLLRQEGFGVHRINMKNARRVQRSLVLVEESMIQHSLIGGDLAAYRMASNLDDGVVASVLKSCEEFNYDLLPANAARCFVHDRLRVVQKKSAVDATIGYSRAYSVPGNSVYLRQVLGLKADGLYKLLWKEPSKDKAKPEGRWVLSVRIKQPKVDGNNPPERRYEIDLPMPAEIAGGGLRVSPDLSAMITEREKLVRQLSQLRFAIDKDHDARLARVARLLSL